MDPIATTPPPPYVAVIFTAVPSGDPTGYLDMAIEMVQLAAQQPGYLGIETNGGNPEITVSYWADAASAQAWKQVAEHLEAQRLGAQRWYDTYRVRVCTVDRDYGPTGSFDT